VNIWSDDDMQFIDVEVVWSGSMRTPLPGLGGIARRRAYLLEGAPSRSSQSTEFPTAAEMRGKTELTGLQIRHGAPSTKPCSTACGRFVSAAGMRQGYLRCNECRRTGRGGRQSKKVAA
jgi:hypothetical protein